MSDYHSDFGSTYDSDTEEERLTRARPRRRGIQEVWESLGGRGQVPGAFAWEDDDAVVQLMIIESQRQAVAEIHGIDSTHHIDLPVEVWERIMLHMEVADLSLLAMASKQHRSIAKNTSFLARYFLARNRRSEAIHRATTYPLLFTSDLLKCLLKMGAVMSRYFVQSFCTAHSGSQERNYYGRPWCRRISTEAFLSVVNEAYKIYGNTLKLTAASSESMAVAEWAGSPARLVQFENKIEEIFVVGKFAFFNQKDDLANPYSSGFDGKTTLSTAIAAHPRLVDVLESNGYTFDKADQDAVFNSMFQKLDGNEDDLYKKVDNMLTRFSDIDVSSASCKSLFELTYQGKFDPMPLTEEGQRILLINEGIGPAATPLKVMRRLYREGRAFQDLDQHLLKYLHSPTTGYHRNGVEIGSQKVATYRILYSYFPELLVKLKVKFAVAYITAYEIRLNKAVEDGQYERLRQSLFAMLQELNLQRKEMAKAFSSIEITKPLILFALKAGLFGTDWEDKIETILTLMIHFCIGNELSGHRLEEIEQVSKELYKMKSSGRNLITKDFFAETAHSVLCSWGFDLDRLRLEKDSESKTTFRSVIGWLIKSYNLESRPVEFVPKIFNPYGLITYPTQRDRPGQYATRLDFALSSDTDLISLLTGMELNKASAGEVPTLPVIQSTSNATASAGWKHLGHINKLQIAADDSGIAMEDADMEVRVDNKSGDSLESTHVENAQTESCEEADSLKGGKYPTVKKRVYFWRCHKKKGTCQDRKCHHKAKETAEWLLKLFGPHAPAIRDVLFSHVLVNGNTELIERFMVSSSEVTQEDPAVAAEETQIEPVLPTLAHLRVLQAIERRPLGVFTDLLLRGAPFKRGYVKDSRMPVRQKEEDIGQRHEWYIETGAKDDRPFTPLFLEMERLEAFDKEAKKKASKKKAKAISSASSSKSEVKAEPKVEIVKKKEEKMEVYVEIDNSKYMSRGNLARSTRKAIRYDENGKSSDPVESTNEQEEEQGGASSSSKKVKIDEVLDDGMDLSDAEADDVISGNNIGLTRSTANESETKDEEEEEGKEIDMLELNEDDDPRINFDVGSDEYKMSLSSLIGRSKSLKLWIEHLEVLQWIEKREGRLNREKAAERKKESGVQQHTTKSRFLLGVNDMLKKLNALNEKTDEVMESAIKARKAAIKKRKAAAKGKGGSKSTVSKEGKGKGKAKEVEVVAPKKATRSKRKRGNEVEDEGEEEEVEMILPEKKERSRAG